MYFGTSKYIICQNLIVISFKNASLFFLQFSNFKSIACVLFVKRREALRNGLLIKEDDSFLNCSCVLSSLATSKSTSPVAVLAFIISTALHGLDTIYLNTTHANISTELAHLLLDTPTKLTRFTLSSWSPTCSCPGNN